MPHKNKEVKGEETTVITIQDGNNCKSKSVSNGSYNKEEGKKNPVKNGTNVVSTMSNNSTGATTTTAKNSPKKGKPASTMTAVDNPNNSHHQNGHSRLSNGHVIGTNHLKDFPSLDLPRNLDLGHNGLNSYDYDCDMDRPKKVYKVVLTGGQSLTFIFSTHFYSSLDSQVALVHVCSKT